MKLTLSVNGDRRDVDVPPNTTLLSVLRDDLNLTGTRYGCGRGQCGACYVIADAGIGAQAVGATGRVAGRGARVVASCLLTADQAARMEITTVEGLARNAALHPVQQAFVDEDAMQCGYCTSGMVIAAVALLESDPNPDETSIRDALAGNLCRCGVYGRAIRAVQRASSP
jgi:aerobic-type carbon monoxide dehydrogenase small subunit (CoxS/CutS family)